MVPPTEWGPQQNGAQSKVPQLPPPVGGPAFNINILGMDRYVLSVSVNYGNKIEFGFLLRYSHTYFENNCNQTRIIDKILSRPDGQLLKIELVALKLFIYMSLCY